MQKVFYDLLGIVDHREEEGSVYLFNELIGPKNTDHTISYLLHYLKSSGKIPGWVRRVQIFMDNAGSTNKNKYLMAAVCEVVQQKVLDFFRISFMVAGHTKFAPDQMFAQIARLFYSSDVFNEKQLTTVVGCIATVVMDSGKIVRSWCEVVGEKYTNLPGIRDLHNFIALRNPGQNAIMKVRKMCYSGALIDTPMKVVDASHIALPTVNHCYYALKRIKELSENKKKDLQQMCKNFIYQEEWHELLVNDQ